MEAYLKAAAAVLALLATSVGIVAAISQLTIAAQLRRRVEFYRAVLEAKYSSESPLSSDIIKSLHDTALARILARQAVPLRRFVVPVTGFLAVIALTFSAGREGPNALKLYGVPGLLLLPEAGGGLITIVGFGCLVFVAVYQSVRNLLGLRRLIEKALLEGAVEIELRLGVTGLVPGRERLDGLKELELTWKTRDGKGQSAPEASGQWLDFLSVASLALAPVGVSYMTGYTTAFPDAGAPGQLGFFLSWAGIFTFSLGRVIIWIENYKDNNRDDLVFRHPKHVPSSTEGSANVVTPPLAGGKRGRVRLGLAKFFNCRS